MRDEIRRLQDQLRRTSADVKWVRPESVHLTLKFLGYVDEAQIEPLAQASAGAAEAHPQLALRLDGMGVFPSRSRPRVVWLGLAGDVERLSALQKDIESAAADFGFEPENRAFTPHLTLGRVRSGRGRAEMTAALEGLEPRPLEFRAEEVILFRSDLKPTGAVYTPLSRLPLKPE
ncbi:MAG: RNA 2',3'-cyclic phosphodiesterase [Pseudomonadota bacterium]